MRLKVTAEAVKQAFKKFQFLLVRLKVSGQFSGIKMNLISIPSGAIKSVILLAICTQKFWFQFLLVRLKATPLINYRFGIILFQFLLVRLKVRPIPNLLLCNKLISIPSGAIKSHKIVFFFFDIFLISIPSGAIKSQPLFYSVVCPWYFNSFWCD